jgi:hypothetical protein
MGTTVQYGQSKKQVIDSIVSKHDILDYRVVGNHLWALAKNDKNKHYILLVLISVHKPNGIGTKFLDELMGPYYYDCPLSLLKRSDFAEQNKEWHDDVRQHHENKKKRATFIKNLKVGQVVSLEGRTIPNLTIYCLNPLKGTYNGYPYKVPRTAIKVE